MKKFFTLFALAVIPSLIGAEALLRLQQWWGPVYDLEMRHVRGVSDPELESLNHRPFPMKEMEYDADGIRREPQRPKYGERAVRILFMGDSFMQGYPGLNSIPQRLYEEVQQGKGAKLPLEFLNAGVSSYSPTIFTVQARQLIPKIKPHFVVIDIDETDLGDDCYVYRNLARRDEQGRLFAVRGSPAYFVFLNGLMGAREHSLYLFRFAHKLYATHVLVPQLEKKDQRHLRMVVARDLSPSAEATHREAIAYFAARVDELLKTVGSLLGSFDRILVLHHPHPAHLLVPPKNNDLVAKTVRRVCAANHVRFFDAQPELKKEFGGEKYLSIYFKNDIHFNPAGIKAYAKLITPHFEEMITASSPPAFSAATAQP